MKLTVVIVNYNVRYFLDHCLRSVQVAAQKVATEVVVVDNCSTDGSIEMVREKYPEVRLVANQDNVGFSRANNQAMREAKGEYVLLLNPDTLVGEDTFQQVVDFMDQHPDSGGLGVHMVDGKGRFLPESKRGLPTPAVAFYKIFGLSSLFPQSRKFGRYHLGYLNREETHEIEVLSGAFMLMRKAALDKVGLLDEAFFMYGEDIDLSYRIILGGYKNYYFPNTSIIHYKGESTKKSSVNYVFVFYKAMVIFAKKHFAKQSAWIFSFLINVAIWLRAGLAVFSRLIYRSVLPVLDAATFLVGLFLLKAYYQNATGIKYEEDLIAFAFPFYALVWLFAIFGVGGYEKPIRLHKVASGVMTGTAIILIAYALLPESMRFSRALILLGTVWGLFTTLLYRWVFHLIPVGDFEVGEQLKKRVAIVGGADERNRIQGLLHKTVLQTDFIAPVNPHNQTEADHPDFVGTLSQLPELVRVFRIDEVIFSTRDLPHKEIIAQMVRLEGEDLEFKIAPDEAEYIIGSNSLNTSGELYVMDAQSIDRENARRKKRLLDVVLSLLFLLSWPLGAFLVRKPVGFLRNIFQVLSGHFSWVGYFNYPGALAELPKIRPGVLTPLDRMSRTSPDEVAEKLNRLYAMEYRLLNDLEIIFRGFAHLGRS